MAYWGLTPAQKINKLVEEAEWWYGIKVVSTIYFNNEYTFVVETFKGKREISFGREEIEWDMIDNLVKKLKIRLVNWRDDMKPEIKEILANIEQYDDWEYEAYPLQKEEAEVILKTLKEVKECTKESKNC